jgi:hypothetical protein
MNPYDFENRLTKVFDDTDGDGVTGRFKSSQRWAHQNQPVCDVYLSSRTECKP